MSAPNTSLTDALGHAASDKRLEVLRLVARSGSISQAGRELGISYKAAWQAIDTLTNLSGTVLVERTVGGSGGGGACITEQGLALLELADALAQARAQVLSRRGLGSGTAVGLGLRTSMRNQLPCRVLACELPTQPDPLVWVRLQTESGDQLLASLTRESADLLGMQVDLRVLVMCKATAVVVTLPDSLPVWPEEPGWCHVCGEVQLVSKGGERDEVVLGLPGGATWVGFAAHAAKFESGMRACAQMQASALVIGLAD
ncbi:TOBE domain-containing protein [Rhodoferax sp.]|uniref:TOBE domain-containing protein n=1 Tax=Rhodoferax sp. TaxID=50421 RepID=UPI00284B588B|nr:TOBE domain-containing protein [Rhodoferax sp.]MDR3370669.1 LysR family transcriptional regulator [Rhodoferax sp.]